MKPELISFDAAGTLIDVRWQPGLFAVECAEAAGLQLDRQTAREGYERLLHTRWRAYCEIQMKRDDALADAFWADLSRDWLLNTTGDDSLLDPILEIARERLYGKTQKQFSLFEDALAALSDLKAMGYRMVVLSNWDHSLHRVVTNLGIASYFEHVFASLQEGPEKPDPELFRILCDRVGLGAERIVHVGDHPVDDLQGARGFGMRALLLDRTRPRSEPPFISTLCDLPELLQWID